ncbi:MAG TPA: transaldolase [Actinomycetes bacterium]|jgi:transaldolase|nr:transaldolase [Actinomycetes bacterium]
MSNPIQELTREGVSVWVDSIARDWLEKGELRRLRDQYGIVGVTSNPTIFQAAMAEGSFYDDQLASLADQGLGAQGIFERLALYDIRWAAHELRPVYQATGGRDGYVSYELPPDIARDPDESIFQAARLFDLLGLPNVLIKIPATVEGLPAIRASIAAGINVNVTLIFSIARYREVVDAYLSGLEERAARGGELSHIASVASFFVSRLDTLVDPKLEERFEEGGPDAALAEARLGTAAIDNAKLAYQAWLELFAGPRWQALQAKGARHQRCLWGSTSTKNPHYRDVLYSEELVGRDTVNTMPLATVEAFADHGIVRGQTVLEGLDRARRLWSDLIRVGIDEEEVGQQLEDEGVDKFAASYQAVLETIEAKRAQAARHG